MVVRILIIYESNKKISYEIIQITEQLRMSISYLISKAN